MNANGLHLVYAGAFRNYDEALALKNSLMAKGMTDVFVTTFSGDTKIPLQKALGKQ